MSDNCVSVVINVDSSCTQLSRCVESVRVQTYSNIEIILMGKNLNSINYPDIKIIHTESCEIS